ncbi:MAG: flagellar hook protein FlgE [Janthinobacterium lividum]
MSLFGTLNTGVSGMAAQASMLSTIGDNIANSSTTGYKSASVSFQTMLGNQTVTDYTSGGVQTNINYSIGDQGTLASTTSATDLAVKGSGFFVVQGADGTTALTRAGSFVPDSSGDLINTAGYKLLGYNLTDGSTATANGTGGLQVINLSNQQLNAAPSQNGSLQFNVDSNTVATTGTTPGATGVTAGGASNNSVAITNATTDGSSKTSLVAYDSLGNPVTLDVYLTKTTAADPTATPPVPAKWEAAIYNHANINAAGTGYDAAPLSTQTLNYDGTTGKLISIQTGAGAAVTSPLDLSVQIPNGKTLSIDVSQSTQLASAFNVNTASLDGSAPSKLDHVTIGTDGTVTSVYANGVSQATYRIPLADVPSPDNLTSLSGNAYQVSLASGSLTIGAATTGALGAIDSSSLESSDVDLATELTSMISAQRSYEANSKVIQASSDLLKVIDQLSG